MAVKDRNALAGSFYKNMDGKEDLKTSIEGKRMIPGKYIGTDIIYVIYNLNFQLQMCSMVELLSIACIGQRIWTKRRV